MIKTFTLKNYTKYILVFGTILFMIACSTKKDNFATRNFQALNTKYNVLFNGGEALDKGIVDLKSQYKDNFWEILPVERQQITQDQILPGTAKNANFDRAETKATKAIQRRSMNIDGTERNPQIDEAHLMLGKARYYDQRFVPALEAFNYILYKYPKSDKIYEAKIWREKTNIHLENEALAITNLSKLLKEIKFKDQVFADANATLAQAFLKEEQKDSAIAKLKNAIRFTKVNEEKSRYRFIVGQLQEELNQKDSAFVTYQSIIDMKRKAPRQYVIQAEARQANQFDYSKGDTVAFLKKFNALLKDRENRPFLGTLNHQLAVFYDKSKNNKQAKKYYNASLKLKSPDDSYLEASNYRNLADIYFYDAKYATAGKYYDSTMTVLNPRLREFKNIKKKRENLQDVIKFEAIAQKNDSILKLIELSEAEKVKYFEDYIAKLKIDDAKQKLESEKQKSLADAQDLESSDESSKNIESQQKNAQKKQFDIAPDLAVASSSANQSNFYFYNPTTVAFGKAEFRKIWGDRILKENWRNSESGTKSDVENPEEEKENSEKLSASGENPRYTVPFYINQIPTKQSEIDLLIKDRNFAYYQLGVIYKEKFKEYTLASNKLESLLTKNPEERLILPSLYNLYKIYEITNKPKAQTIKEDIIRLYPESRYAQILGNTNSNSTNQTPEMAYDNLYKLYKSGDYREVYLKVDPAIAEYPGDEIVSKFELLKANTTGKITGIAAFKKALNFVALTYPNTQEGKDSEEFLSNDIPAMEDLQFNEAKPKSWKILYKVPNTEDKNTKNLQETIVRFIKDRTSNKLSTSLDLFTMDENFIVIHGIQSEDGAKGVVSVLKEFKEYKVTHTPIVISNENYKIIQIKKNLEEYLADPNKVPEVREPKPQPVPKQEPTPDVIPQKKKQVPKTKPQSQMAPPSEPGMPPNPDQMMSQPMQSEPKRR